VEGERRPWFLGFQCFRGEAPKKKKKKKTKKGIESKSNGEKLSVEGTAKQARTRTPMEGRGSLEKVGEILVGSSNGRRTQTLFHGVTKGQKGKKEKKGGSKVGKKRLSGNYAQ